MNAVKFISYFFNRYLPVINTDKRYKFLLFIKNICSINISKLNQYENSADFTWVGMFDFQIVENANATITLIQISKGKEKGMH